jgi:pimeloyl-ACP methyl ester carboxylesterase
VRSTARQKRSNDASVGLGGKNEAMLRSVIRRRTAHVNGVDLHVMEAGTPGNPVVVLSHGFPEGAYSWRHQLAPLAEAGYHVLAPYQRGYGSSSCPAEVEAYGIGQLTDDLLALVGETGQEQAIYVGHDWGAMIVWDLARLHPERVKAVVGVSVPFVSWPAPPTQLMKMLYTDRFFYILYFQPVGPAETELAADPRRTQSSLLWGGSGLARRDALPMEAPPMEGTGFLTMAPVAPDTPWTGPEGVWLTAADLDRYVADFTESGYFGPVSYYRNLDANFEVVKDLSPDRLTMPSYFIGGEQDIVLTMDPTGVERMRNLLPNFRGHTMIPGAGHWIQQETPNAFNTALIGFLATL